MNIIHKTVSPAKKSLIVTMQCYISPFIDKSVFCIYQATYEVKLGRTQEMSSISNMPIDQAGVTMDGTDEYVWDVYQKSVKMSTYLVAFVVSKFSYVEAEKRANNVRFRIWSQPSTLDQTAYAKEMGPKMLEFFENYFNVPFPLPKQVCCVTISTSAYYGCVYHYSGYDCHS